MTGEGAAALARIYLQTFALSVVFVAAGQALYRTVFPRAAGHPATLRWSLGYFLGITAFYPAYVFLSRIVGAKAALAVTLAAMGVLALREAAVSIRRPGALAAGFAFVAALLLLTALFSVTNAGLWLNDVWPRPDIAMLNHFGSIHAGRYANYAVYIAEHDRVPYLGQNGGQSMLASVHLLLGPDSPLAAVMVWVPFSLAYLALFLLGLLRAEGFSMRACAVAAAALMFCNVAVSLTHVMVFDNGSPLAFIGYTDMAVAIGTFMAFGAWLQVRLQEGSGMSRAHLALPLLLGLTWAWYAPQNIVVGLVAAVGTAAVMRRREASLGLRPVAEGLVVFAAAVAVGATQFGSLLPKGMREDTGFWEQEVKPDLRLRPYVQFARNQWTNHAWNEIEPNVYERLYVIARPIGLDEVYRVRAWTAETNLWTSIRIYGFPLLGLASLFLLLRRAPPGDPDDMRWRIAWWFSAFAFAVGFLIVYLFELDRNKWWLTRFLVPGAVAALVCLAYGALRGGALLRPLARRASWAVLLVVATLGPLFEVVTVSYRNLVERARADPVAERLDFLATRRGPFIFEMMLHDNAVAAEVALGIFRYGGGWFELGGPARRQGLALFSPPMSLTAGKRRVGFCVRLEGAADPSSPLLELDVVDGGGAVLARRVVRRQDLEQGMGGEWAWLPFDLPRAADGARLRLWSRSATPLKIMAVRLERE